ncbi:MAG TPA: hypothetical protein VMV43_07020 [Candidatus Nanopelagicaceae bacterium]|nr:hypothetical protein [Candidatus Nanopelagicaceae bacterium]
MEEETPIPQIIRMDQVFAVGGTFEDPSEFTQKVNKNLMILKQSDKNFKVKDIKFSAFSDPRYSNAGPILLAFIIAEVDVDITPEPDVHGKKRKKKKKKSK